MSRAIVKFKSATIAVSITIHCPSHWTDTQVLMSAADELKAVGCSALLVYLPSALVVRCEI